MFACAASSCSGDNVLEPCDIREDSCQLNTLLAVQDVRGGTWDPWLSLPPTRVIREAQYREEVLAERAKSLIEQGGYDYLTAGLKLLRMIDPEESPDAGADFAVSSVAAFYDPRSRKVSIIDRGGGGNQLSEVATLAHEFVHAAQDRDVGFGRLYDHVRRRDGTLAINALIEGEATLYEMLVVAKQRELPKGYVNWDVLLGWAADIRERVAEDPSPFRITNNEFVYPLGGYRVARAYQRGGPLEVRRLFDAPPLSMDQYMRPEAQVAPPTTAWACDRPTAPGGMLLVAEDELGALNLYAFATRAFSWEPAAWSSGVDWTGDRFYLYADRQDPNAVAVTWQLRLRSAESALALQAAIAAVPTLQAIRTAAEGNMLHVFASSMAIEEYRAWSECSTQ
jgi:hypothetical protein